MRALTLVALVVGLTFGCSDSNAPGGPGHLSSLKIVSGNAQHAIVGTALPSAIVVKAVDDQSRGIPGVAVTFTVLAGAGTITGAATTNAQGQANATWTLGTTADTQRVDVKGTSASGAVQDTVLAVALAASAKHLVVAGDSQAAAPGRALADSVSVTLTDRYGNPTPGDTVTWTVTAGGGSVSPVKSVTNVSGTAKTQWRLGAALGSNTLSASAGASLAASFFANAATTNPNVHIRIQQRSDTAPYIGDALHLSATATDKTGAVIPGAVLAWSTMNAAVATVQSAGNLAATATSKANGAARVIASYNGSADTVLVVVQQVPVQIQLGDRYPDVVLGHTAQLIANAVDAGGAVVPNVPLVWHVMSSSIATIATGGSATGVALGQTGFSVTSTKIQHVAQGTLFVSRAASTALFTQVAVGDDHACGLGATGEVWCWGSVGSTTVPGPVPVAGALAFTLIATRGSLTCGLTGSGATYCWGAGGTLNPVLSYGSTPVQVPGGIAFTSVTVGYDHACGLTSDGAAYCWGNGAFGALGTGSLTSSTTPVGVAGGLRFSTVSAIGLGACGLLTSGVPYCWGDNSVGEVGNGDQSVDACPDPVVAGTPMVPCSKSPIPVAGSHVFTSLAGGASQVCGVEAGGSVYCWGGNNYGELGDGTSSGPSGNNVCSQFVEPFCSLTPVAVSGGLHFTAIAAGTTVTCALDPSGHAYCWGNDGSGSVGNGQTTFAETTPTAVAGGLTFTRLAVGSGACAIVSGGKTYCWGPAPLPQASVTDVPTLITPP